MQPDNRSHLYLYHLWKASIFIQTDSYFHITLHESFVGFPFAAGVKRKSYNMKIQRKLKQFLFTYEQINLSPA